MTIQKRTTSRSRDIVGWILVVGSFVSCGILLTGPAAFLPRFISRAADQIFRGHFAFMVSGVLFATGLLLISYECKAIRVLSGILLFLALLYPAVISLLYFGRGRLGESYAYLILGDLAAMLLGLIGGVIFVYWLLLYSITVMARLCGLPADWAFLDDEGQQ
ncbi:MAG: hypothetical protein ACYST6_12595 [Planctomycetota bacterium]|jgi:hypothetical protein